MSAATANELTLALSRFCTAHSETHFQPALEDLGRQLRQFENAIETLKHQVAGLDSRAQDQGSKVRYLEIQSQKLEERQVALDQALQARVGLDQFQKLERGADVLRTEVEELRRTAEAQENGTAAAAERIEEAMQDLSGRVAGLGQSVLLGSDRVLQLEASKSNAERLLEEMQQAIHSKASTGEQQQIKAALSSLQGQLAGVEREVQDKASSTQVQQLRSAASTLEAQAADTHRLLQEKASLAQAQQLKSTLEMIHGQTSSFEKELQGLSSESSKLSTAMLSTQQKCQSLEHSLSRKAEASKLESVCDVLSTWQAKLPAIEQDLQLGADRVQQMDCAVSGLSKQMQQMEQSVDAKVEMKQLQQFENLVLSIQSHMTQVEQALQEKASSTQVLNLKGSVTAAEIKIADLEQSVQEKASGSQIQHLKAALSTAESKLSSIEQAVHEKVGAGQMQQLKSIVMGLQTQGTSLEQSLHDKVGTEHLQQVKSALVSLQAQQTSLEQSVHEKASASHLQQLRNALSLTENKVVSVEHSLHDKVDLAQIQTLNESLTGLQTKVSGIERGVWEGMDCVQAMEAVLTGLKSQTTSLEHQLQEKVSNNQMQTLCDAVVGVKSKVIGLESTVRAGGERVNDIEGAVMSVGTQLAHCKQALQDRVGGSQGRMLTLELEKLDRHHSRSRHQLDPVSPSRGRGT